jgi:hypothetical protein
MDKILQTAKILMYVSVALCFMAAATILTQVSLQMHKTPNLMLKLEATVDYLGRAAQNFDKATAVWKDASAKESNYLDTTLPKLSRQVETNLNNSNALLVSLKTTSDTLAASAATITTQTNQTLATTDALVADTNKNLQPVLQGLALSSASVTNLVTDPEVKKTLVNVQDATANTAEATKQAAQILKDGRVVADKYVQPERWWMKVLNYTLKGGSLAYDFIR